jgi:hypothetical protein
VELRYPASNHSSCTSTTTLSTEVGDDMLLTDTVVRNDPVVVRELLMTGGAIRPVKKVPGNVSGKWNRRIS